MNGKVKKIGGWSGVLVAVALAAIGGIEAKGYMSGKVELNTERISANEAEMHRIHKKLVELKVGQESILKRIIDLRDNHLPKLANKDKRQ